MGQSLTWLCVKGLDEKDILRAAGLQKSGEVDDCLGNLSLLNLKNGWFF